MHEKTPSKAPFAPADDEDNAVSRAFLMCIKRASTPTSGWRSARWHTRALSPTLEQRFCEFWRGRHRQPTIGKRGLVGQKSWALASGAPIFTSQPSVERLLEGLIARTQRRGEGAHVHERQQRNTVGDGDAPLCDVSSTREVLAQDGQRRGQPAPVRTRSTLARAPPLKQTS